MKFNWKQLFLLLIPLGLSAFIHLWNPVGFPDIFYDEGVYMHRAMHVLEGLGPQERCFHDHPFFGQLFLAGVLSIIGYPHSLNPTIDPNSIQMLYLVPRVLMGILAIADTFLIYKISERSYGRNAALLASVLFAVMPITWIVRRILLDSILLPFLLTSILLAVHSKDSKNKTACTILSGVFLGIAIFTKEPIFIMIPLVAFLIYKNSNKNLRIVGLWFIPVILIPLIWPAQSITTDQFHTWLSDILYQTQRHNVGFAQIVGQFFEFDPVLLMLASGGILFAIKKRDFMLLLWIIPFVIFLSLVGYAQYFYWIPVLPAFCVAAARFIIDAAKKIPSSRIQQLSPYVITIGIGIFGLASTTMLITSNVSGQFEAATFALQYVQANNMNNNNSVTMISSPVYSWIFKYIFHEPYVLWDYRDLLFYPLPTEKVLLIADSHFKGDIAAEKQLRTIYDNTMAIKKFDGGVLNYDNQKYPYTNMQVNYEGGEIEIRANKEPVQNIVPPNSCSFEYWLK